MTEPWNGRHAPGSSDRGAGAWGDEASSHDSAPSDLYDEGRGWLRRGLRRQRPAVITALLVSWTSVWLAPWGAVLGGLVGMLAAGGFATGWAAQNHLYEFGAGQAVSVVGLGLGLVLGALGGFVLTVAATTLSNPLAGVVAAALGGVLMAAVTVFAAALERSLLRLRGYRRLARDEALRVMPLVQQVAEDMALDGLPRFAMSDVPIPNAWTHMRTIVLTAGLLQMLDDAELEAVLAHELHHWREGDAVGLRLLWAAALPIAVTLNVGTWIAGSGSGQQASSSDRGSTAPRAGRGVLGLIGWAVAWAPWVIVRLVLAPMSAATQRRYEYEADAAAASIGCASALSSALSKIGAFESGRTGWERAIAATHPPVALRIEALATDDGDGHVARDLGRPSLFDLLRVLRTAL